MATESHDHDALDPSGGEMHENSWSANLEKPEYADAPAATREGARRAIQQTASGYHVNLVTHGDNGHPETYLFEFLDDVGVEYEYVKQCGCGGHVTRVQV